MKKYYILLMMLWQLQSAFATNGLFPTFMGTQAAGRAGTDIGVAIDATCIATNPAGIGFLHGKQVELSVGSFFPIAKYKDKHNDERSQFEPTPVGFFAMTWGNGGKFWEPITDSISYALGNKPDSSEYIYIVNDLPSLSHYHVGNCGQGNLCTQSNNYSLIANGEGAILSNFRLFSFIPAASLQQKIIFSQDQLPNLPPSSEVVSITARIQGQGTYYLQVEDKKSDLSSQGYANIVWDRPYSPACVQIISTQTNETPQSIEVSLGYRLLNKTYWVKVENNITDTNSNIYYMFIARDEASYNIQGFTEINLSFNSASSDSGMKNIVYTYKLDSQNPNSFVQIDFAHQNKTYTSSTHERVYRENSDPHIPICNTIADHQFPDPERPSGWKFALGIIPQTGSRYTIELKSDIFPEGIENRTDITFISFVPSVAYRFNDFFSIGASLNINFEMFQIDGVNCQKSTLLQGRPIKDMDIAFGDYLIKLRDIYHIKGEMDADYLYGFGIGGKIGFLWKLSDTFQFGAAYTPPTWMTNAKGEMTVDYTRHFNIIDVASISKIFLPNKGRYGFKGDYDVEVEFTLPQRIGVGFSWFLFDQLTLSMDCHWIHYSDTQSEMKIKIKNGTNADLNALVGGDRTRTVLNMGWDDQFVVSVGLSWQVSPNCILRCGYNYGTNPVPDKYENPQFISIMEHHINIGGSYLLHRNISVHTALEFTLPHKINSKENLVHEDFSNSSLEVFNIGAMMGVSLRF
jgi:long-subunit fatty acid transport protein